VCKLALHHLCIVSIVYCGVFYKTQLLVEVKQKFAQKGFTSVLSCMYITCTNVDNCEVLALLVGVDREYLTNLLHVNWIFSR
jgi:hypothetical protein